MMVSATHTHSAPAAMGCLGTRQDPEYVKFLIPKIAESIVEAHKRLQPARIGWGSIDDWEHTHNRRWILRSDKMQTDPFGVRSVRAMMHPGYQNPNYIGQLYDVSSVAVNATPATVDEGGIVFESLYEIGLKSLAEQDSHRSLGVQVTGGNGFFPTCIGNDHAPETITKLAD